MNSTLRRVEYVLQSAALGAQSGVEDEEIELHAWENYVAISEIVNEIIPPLIETLSKGYDATRRDDVKHHIGWVLSRYMPGLPDARIGIPADMEALARLAPRLNRLVQADTMYTDDEGKRFKLIKYYRLLVVDALFTSLNCTRPIDFRDYVGTLFN